MFLFTYMVSINNPFLYVLYIEESLLQTIEKSNIHYMGFFLDCWEDLKTGVVS